MTDGLIDEILDGLCRYWDFYIAAVGLLGVFLLLTIVGFTVIEPWSPAYVVNLVNLIGLSIFILVISSLLAYCFRSERAPD